MFGLGFSEILIIAVIAILFLGPDKLPSAMVEVAKFFRQMKNTVGNVKDSIEQEMNVSEIKAEALAYKRELLEAKEEIAKKTDISGMTAELTNLNSDIFDELDSDTTPKKVEPKEEKVSFDKKTKKENVDV